MSLRVWLPLTKDLRNQGLDSITVTNNGATFNSAGKLGGCYSFDGTNDYLVGTYDATANITFAAWINMPTLPGGRHIFDARTSAGVGYQPMYLNNTGIQVGCSSSGYSSFIYTWVTDTWYHICVTHNTTEAKCYVNGVLIGTSTTGKGVSLGTCNFTLGSRCNQSNYSNVKLNDVRIYDHCLSPLEVKKLAQGLVLHYPLNRNGWGQENLLVDTYNWSTLTNASTVSEGYWYNNGGTAVREYDNINNITYCKIWHSDSSSWTRYSRQYVTMQPNTYYTVSILCRINTDIAHLTIRNDRNEAITFFAQNVELTNKNWEWKFFTAKTHTNTSQEPFTIYAQVNSDGVLSSDTSIDIAMVKLEEGSIATPWCPNSSDTFAATMGLNSTTEYDCSGFCNNGTKNGTYSYTSDTPKYAVSTNFSGTETIATATTGADILTLSCWAKTSKSKSTSQMMVADSASKLCCSFYQGNFISFYGGNSGYDTGSKCSLGSEYKENEWNHFVSVKTGEGTRDCYCNGVKLTPTTNDWWSTAAGFWIGNRNTGGNLPFYGQICDVRAYATALSAADVLDLYNNTYTVN